MAAAQHNQPERDAWPLNQADRRVICAWRHGRL
jgi:hypothetical protein